jgi:ABC-type molybdenum transport system ATPase subunit/photorepair protein PhrA
MHSNIEKLMKNQEPVGEYFAQAAARWKDILSDISTISVQDLARKLTTEQMWFEHHCGGRWDGQEVMVWTGFASIYNTQTGYDDESKAAAAKLLEAFGASMCSVEVKGGAKEAAKSYYVGE